MLTDFAQPLNMTLDLNFPLKGLPNNGDPGADLGTTAARVLAEALMSATKGDALKQYEQAIMLAGCGKIDLDSSDKETLQRFVKENDNLRVIAKGPILKAISELK